MGTLIKKNHFLVGKLQTVIDQPETLDPLIDYQVVSEADIDFAPVIQDVSIISADGMATENPVIGNVNGTIKLKVPFCSIDAVKAPVWGAFLESGGFAHTLIDLTTTKKQHVYTRALNSQKAFTFNEYFNDPVSNEAVINRLFNAMFNSFKITGQSGTVPVIEASGVGVPGNSTVYDDTLGTGVPTGNEPTVNATGIVSPVQPHYNYTTVQNASSTIIDTGYKVNKWGFDFTNKVEQESIMQGYGFGASKITELETKFNFDTLLDTSMINLPINQLRKGVVGSVIFTFGQIIGRKIKVEITNGYLKAVKSADQGNLKGSSIDGVARDNQLIITANYDLVA